MADARFHRPRGAARWTTRVVLLALALALVACGEGEGPVGAPGGRDGVELRYVTPRLQVRPVGPSSRVVLSLVARRPGRDGEVEPWPGAVFEVRREAGAAQPEAFIAETDDRGVATIQVTTPGTADETKIEFVLRGDRRQHLPFDVVTAPTREVDLEVGEVEEIEPASEGVLLRFDAGPDRDIALIPYQLDPDRSGASYRLLHQGADLDPDAVGFGIEPPAVPGTRSAVQVHDYGHVEPGTFYSGGLTPAGVPPSLNIESCRIEADRRAPLRYLGQRVALYVDAPPEQHQARIDSLGREFDERIFPTNTEIFGQTTDEDGNGVVLVVMTPELQGLGGVYCDALRTLAVELFYAVWNADDPIDAPLATLAHEHQHVINAGHHLRTRGGIGDDRWVGEGLSFVAEALNGYWRSPLVRVWLFLSGQNGGMSMLPLEYGGAFADEYQMFFLYLGDRFGRDVYRRLGTSGRTGVSNVEHVTGMPFDSLVRDWFVANAVNGHGTALAPRYRYSTIDFGGMGEEIAACQCLPRERFDGMNLESLSLANAFDIFRSMEGYDADYYRLRPPEGEPGRRYELYFDAFRGRAVRLAIVRLR